MRFLQHTRRKWHRFVREKRHYFFAAFLLILILPLVALLFWILTKPNYR